MLKTSDLTKKLKVEINKKDSEVKEIIRSIIVEGWTQELLKGGKIKIINFGSFSVYKRKARRSLNPATGQEIYVPSKPAIKFTISRNLKKKIETKYHVEHSVFIEKGETIEDAKAKLKEIKS